MTHVAEVRLWGRTIGAVSLLDGEDVAAFEYAEPFTHSGIEIAPLTLPLSTRVYRFTDLATTTFHGLPGLLADSLPDKFGHALIDAWLASQGRQPDSFNVIERLCYTGKRGMGALEFLPAIGKQESTSRRLEIDQLVDLASAILSQRDALNTFIDPRRKASALTDILRVGTSAGGARAKAVIAWNRSTNEVRSGQVEAGDGFEYWLMKFDGVAANRDKELDDPKGYGAIEYAYYLMAKDCGITMSESRLFEEKDRRHFMTRRFDRVEGGRKLHLQSLGALAHYDFNRPGAYSYEQAMLTIRKLGLPMKALEEQFRRMVFNVVARNQDDHVKNIAFLMDKSGTWTLSPAFDLTYSYNPKGHWTSRHQMTVNGKREHLGNDDLLACARSASLKRGRAQTIMGEVKQTVSNWTQYADRSGVDPMHRDHILKTLRL